LTGQETPVSLDRAQQSELSRRTPSTVSTEQEHTAGKDNRQSRSKSGYKTDYS